MSRILDQPMWLHVPVSRAAIWKWIPDSPLSLSLSSMCLQAWVSSTYLDFESIRRAKTLFVQLDLNTKGLWGTFKSTQMPWECGIYLQVLQTHSSLDFQSTQVPKEYSGPYLSLVLPGTPVTTQLLLILFKYSGVDSCFGGFLRVPKGWFWRICVLVTLPQIPAPALKRKPV